MTTDDRKKFTTTINKDLLAKVKKKMIDEDRENINELIELLFTEWLKDS